MRIKWQLLLQSPMEKIMNTTLITIELSLPDPINNLPSLVEQTLRQWGDPLRWAITTIDPQTRMATIEAVVTSP